MDESGISQKGYSILYKALAEKGASKRNKGSLLPKPMKVKSARHHVNSEVLEKLGSPIHIEATYVDKEREVVFNQHNNIFFDLETLQRYAVEFFEISTEECGGVLKFVLKLDECEILKNRKMERVTISLMNRALDPSITKDDKQHFSVQSEMSNRRITSCPLGFLRYVQNLQLFPNITIGKNIYTKCDLLVNETGG